MSKSGTHCAVCCIQNKVGPILLKPWEIIVKTREFWIIKIIRKHIGHNVRAVIGREPVAIDILWPEPSSEPGAKIIFPHQFANGRFVPCPVCHSVTIVITISWNRIIGSGQWPAGNRWNHIHLFQQVQAFFAEYLFQFQHDGGWKIGCTAATAW